MDYVRIGQSGLVVSRLCLGCMSFGTDPAAPGWTLDEDAARPIVRAAVEAGVNFFDTANVYAAGMSEVVTGRLVREFLPREEAVIATKVNGRMRPGPNGAGLSRKAIFAEIDASLARLGTDYIDLYQIHRWDPQTPIEETLEALHDVVKAGKARYLGASSMAAWQFMKALGLQRARGWVPFVSMQNHLNLLYREEEREMLPLCRSEGIGVLPWSPLARGRLARAWGDTQSRRSQADRIGKSLYDHAETSDRAVHAVLSGAAEEAGIALPRMALAWLLQVPGVTAPIIGATGVAHLEDALAALSLTLDPQTLSALDAAYEPHAVVAYT